MRNTAGTLGLALAVIFCLAGPWAHAAEIPGKWIRYGDQSVNANQQPAITLVNPISGANEAKVAAMIRDANGPISLTIAVRFSQPAVSFYTINTRVSDPAQAVAASEKADEMYAAIQAFLASGRNYLDLGQ